MSTRLAVAVVDCFIVVWLVVVFFALLLGVLILGPPVVMNEGRISPEPDCCLLVGSDRQMAQDFFLGWRYSSARSCSVFFSLTSFFPLMRRLLVD